VILTTYLGHNWLSICPFHVAKRHLSAFVLVKFQLWVVDIGDLLETDYSFSNIHIGQGQFDHDLLLS
jgi:hypothetical protein